MGRSTPAGPTATPGLPPPGALLRGQRDGRLARGSIALSVLVFDLTDSALATAAALPRDRVPAGAAGAGLRRPAGAPAAPLRPAGDLRRRGGGLRRPGPAGRRTSRWPRSSPWRRSTVPSPLTAATLTRAGRRGDARAGGGAARRQRRSQRRLHRRGRGRAGAGRRGRRQLRRAVGAAARRGLLLRDRLHPAHRRGRCPSRARAGPGCASRYAPASATSAPARRCAACWSPRPPPSSSSQR